MNNLCAYTKFMGVNTIDGMFFVSLGPQDSHWSLCGFQKIPVMAPIFPGGLEFDSECDCLWSLQ